VNGLASPLYCPSRDEWEKNAGACDRAVVVLRDPRDLLISLVFSLQSSHVPSIITRLLRGPIEHASPADRLQIGMFLMTQWAERLRTWRGLVSDDSTLVTTYCRLLDSSMEEFEHIFDFLGWPISSATLKTVVADHSFFAKTQRQPGQENRFSHWRKGISGDWKNHFNREMGQCFEETFPGLLADLNYEPSTDWWKGLPESLAEAAPASDPLADLRVVLEEHQKELAVVRFASEERLTQLQQLAADLELHRSAAEDRERQIIYLDQCLREQTTAAAERLRVIEELTAAHRAEESALSYRLFRWFGKMSSALVRRNRRSQVAAERLPA
jgi:hypothetical protein